MNCANRNTLLLSTCVSTKSRRTRDSAHTVLAASLSLRKSDTQYYMPHSTVVSPISISPTFEQAATGRLRRLRQICAGSHGHAPTAMHCREPPLVEAQTRPRGSSASATMLVLLKLALAGAAAKETPPSVLA